MYIAYVVNGMRFMAAPIENNTLYRFRDMNKLFGEFNELENQSIFFAPPEKLNDPVEGFRDIYFQGDKAMWESLFTNYLLSLTVFAVDYAIFGEDKILEQHSIISSIDRTHPNLQTKFKEFLPSFIKSDEIQGLITNILKYCGRVSQVELSYYLSVIHFFALKIVFNALEEDNPENERSFNDVHIDIVDKLNKQRFEDIKDMSSKYGIDAVEFFSQQHVNFLAQQHLLLDLRQETKTPFKKLLINAFPRLYVEKLENFMYPKWFTACFMSTATNSSVWGNYGDYHKGACLIFDIERGDNDKPSVTLGNDVISASKSGIVRGKTKQRFDEIHYNHEQDSINFFDCLGLMPITKAKDEWFIDSDGKYSENIPKFDDEWRESYWNNFNQAITRKTADWQYENEYRLTLNNMFGSYDFNGTTLVYDLKSLKGIVFGIKMPDVDKHRIIEVIEKKVHINEHYDFCFYQAYYCRRSGTIQHTELTALKFKRPEK